MINDLLGEVESTEGVDKTSVDMIRDSIRQLGIRIDRCKQITQGLLGFARKGDAVLKTIDLASFMPEVIRMVEPEARLENVRILCELDPGLPDLSSDSAQLQQNHAQSAEQRPVRAPEEGERRDSDRCEA